MNGGELEEKNMHLMKTLDDAWNSEDWATFSKRHVDDVVVRWPAQPPTSGIDAHRKDGEHFFSAFPDNHVGNNPYKVLFAQGEWTCSIADFTGSHKGPMMGPGGKMISPTNRKFKVDFCTVARWNNDGRIVEENLFYDVVGMMTQLGIM